MSIPRLIFDLIETSYPDIKYRKIMFFSNVTNQVETQYDFHLLRTHEDHGFFYTKKTKVWKSAFQSTTIEDGLEYAINFLQKHEYTKK